MRQRVDQWLVARELAATRSQARDLVLRGAVTIAGRPAHKPGQLVGVDDAAALMVADGAGRYVSRGALKLVAALDAFAFDPSGRVALDVGASTGGFTEVLLARDAQLVYAVDVGRRQLHERLRDDPRVVCHEATDARGITRELIPGPIGAIVADLSFISLAKALPAALALAAPGAWLVALIKPQFEVGPDGVARGGIVRDARLREKAVADVGCWLAAQSGWRIVGCIPSPIAGGDGNQESLIGASYHGE